MKATTVITCFWCIYCGTFGEHHAV